MGNNVGFSNKVRANKKFLGLVFSSWHEVRSKILVWWQNFVLEVIFVLGETFWVLQGQNFGSGEKFFDEGEIWVGGKILVGAKF